MSRPSRDDAKRLKALEGATGLLGAEVIKACGILAIRLRQIYRRAPELVNQIRLADEELARIVDGCDHVQELITSVLETDQKQRSKMGQ